MADPLLALIQEYREQIAINDATDCEACEEDALANATFRSSYDRLCTDPPAATSYEGALAAIRLVADEEETCGQQPDLTVNVLRAALGFLEGVAKADAKLIELGRQFERAKAEARPLGLRRKRLHAVYEAAAAEAGIPDYDAGGGPAHRKLMRECGYKAVSDAFRAKHGEAVKLMKVIHRTRATTLEGVAVKLDAVTFDLYDFDLDPKGGDVAEVQLLRLCKQTRDW